MIELPPWATTGVGSLPFTDVEAAVEHVLGAYDIPFCPQLPRLEGDMITEWLGADPGRCGWSPARDRERPVAWDTLLARLESTPARVVKLQVTGPVTLAYTLGEWLDVAHELAVWLAANAGGQVRALAERGHDALLIVDEPALHVFGEVEGVWDALRACAPVWGLHLCGPVPWDVLTRAEPDVLSFDLVLAPVQGEAAQALRALLARGTRVMWGAIQPHHREHALHGMARLHTALAATGENGERSLLSASCGSGQMSIAREREIATALSDCARAHRRFGMSRA
jgi:hypothetical protein